MTLVFFLKVFSDLCFYFVFAGFAADCFGQRELQFAPILALCLVAALCRMVWDKYPYTKRHRLPLLLLPAAFLLPGDPAGLAALVPAALYVGWSALSGRLHPDYYDAADHFRLELKILPLPFVLLAALQQLERIERVCAPYLLAFLLGSVLLLRMVRHDESTLRQPRFRLLNGLSLAGVCLVCLVLGSPWFRKVLLAVLEGAWRVISMPVLVVVVGLAMILGLLVDKLLPDDFHFEPREMMELLGELGEEGQQQQQELLEQAPNQTSETAYAIFSILGGILAILFVIWLFRKLASGKRKRLYAQEGVQSRYAAAAMASKEPPLTRLTARTPAQQVRYWYQQSLKKTLDEGGQLHTRMDSRQQTGVTQEVFRRQEDDARRLRALYLPARYKDAATAEDAKAAKELYKKLGKEKADEQ